MNSRATNPSHVAGDSLLQRGALIVIPARLASMRLPRKMLLAETGKTLLQHTYEAACGAQATQNVCVAVDSEELAAVVRGFGGEAVLTDPELPSGTDRVAAVARLRPEYDLLVNLQGDEPEMAAEAVDVALRLLVENPDVPMSTVAAPLRSAEALHDPGCVKVVCDARGRALYFSRSVVPHAREWDERLLAAEPPVYWQHLGLYAYRREFLLHLAGLPPGRLEQIERLEQLRVLEGGWPIAVGRVERASRGIDTPEDYAAFVRRSQQR